MVSIAYADGLYYLNTDRCRWLRLFCHARAGHIMYKEHPTDLQRTPIESNAL